MLVWIVILFLWIALILLILHDATKGDSNGSAVVLAAVSSSSEAAPQEEPGAGKQTLGRPKKKKWWSKDSRTQITGAELEAAILEAMKKTAPCQDFIGVIVGRKTSKSHLDPNWEVQGAKFGKADRKLAQETLASVVQRMQKELVLVEERDTTPQRAAGRVVL